MIDSTQKHIISSLNVGSNCFHREEFTTGYLLQCGSTKDVIHLIHCKVHSFTLTYITNVKFNLVSDIATISLQEMTHVILLFLITTENTNLLDITVQEPAEYRITKTSCTTRYEQYLVFKYWHIILILIVYSFYYLC